jgi:hypothetical protein
MTDNISITEKASFGYTVMKDVVIEITPHANYIHLMNQLVDKNFDTTSLDKLDVINTYLREKNSTLLPPSKEYKPRIFLLFLDQMRGSDFVHIGNKLTGQRADGAPFENMRIIEINNNETNENFERGCSDLTPHFVKTYRHS